MIKTTRTVAALLALLMAAGTLTACRGTQTSPVETGTDTLAHTVTEATTEANTETVPAQDIPKAETYSTTSDLSLPSYAFSDRTEDIAYEFVDARTSSQSFGFYQNATSEGNVVTLPARQVTGFYVATASTGQSETTYEFTLKHTVPEAEKDWVMHVFMGLRVSDPKADATWNQGVFIAMSNNRIGLCIGWDKTSMTEIPLSFADGIHVRVVDDPAENLITLYGRPADGGDEVELAYVRITDTEVQMFTPGADTPFATRTITVDVPRSGYCHFWSHLPANDAKLWDVKVSTTRTVSAVEERDGIIPATRDVLADTWVGVDGAGRTVTSSDTLPNGKAVGMFYFICHEGNAHGDPVYNHTEAYLKGGSEELWNVLTSGGVGSGHYWAEPYFGYYCSNDEWVIRKHAQELTAAGVDFVYFDCSNGYWYETMYETILRIWSEMRQEGNDTPEICFMIPPNNQAELLSLWNNLYSVGRYEELWFYWDGKPVILFTGNGSLPDELADFFTLRISWLGGEGAYTELRGENCWPWADLYPQAPGYVRKAGGGRSIEQVVVMCGFWANGSYGTNAGRSYTKAGGGIPDYTGSWDFGFSLMNTTTGLGLAFQEQFDYAIGKDPDLIMVTGWNEWNAGRWEGAPAIGQTIANEYVVVDDPEAREHSYYVDCFNPEYSRDIEAMKGGFGDNYYYQLAQNIRTYKGTRRVEAAFGQWAIDISGSVGQWYAVGPEYRDYTGDTAHRNHISNVGELTYVNETGRNDLLTAKVSSDSRYLYFYIECADPITAAEGENWMNLFLKTDGDDATGWNGFDFILNRSRDGETVSVEKFVNNSWSFETVGTAEYVLNGNYLQIKVEKSLVGAGATFDFKWADNSVAEGDIMQFMDLGDTAPDERFCYRFTTEASEQPLPEGLTADMVVLKTNSYNAYVNGTQMRLVEDNTKATALASGYDIWLPVAFLQSALGIDASNAKTYEHYGVTYVQATALIEAAGKVITVTSDGLIVISDAKVEDSTLLKALYRSLS